MGRLLTILGLIGLLFSIGYFLYFDRTKSGEDFDYINQTRNHFIISAILIAGGYVVGSIEKRLGARSAKCKTCGRRIPRNEIYCFDHLKDAVDRAVDRDHRTGRT
jgi:hypothetical protein